MKLLIIAATSFEIAPFARLNRSAEVLISGVGIASTAYQLTRQLMTSSYDLVIQAGIAGTFSNSLNHGDVVLVDKDIFADIGIQENNKFSTLLEAGFASKNEYPFPDGWLHNYTPEINISPLKKVSAATVSTISDSIEDRERIVHKFDPCIESMEGAALHYVCLQQKTKFLQLRSISNHVGIRDKSKWHIAKAIESLNIKLHDLVELIK